MLTQEEINQLHILFHSEMSHCRIKTARFMLTISKTNEMHIKLMTKELTEVMRTSGLCDELPLVKLYLHRRGAIDVCEEV